MESFVRFSDLVPMTAPTSATSPLKLLILKVVLLLLPCPLLLVLFVLCELFVVLSSVVSLLAPCVAPPPGGVGAALVSPLDIYCDYLKVAALLVCICP